QSRRGPHQGVPRRGQRCGGRNARSRGPDAAAAPRPRPDLLRRFCGGGRLRIAGALTFRGITAGVASGVAALAPFGAGNPRPVFAARHVEIVDGPRKLKERHLKMSLKQDGRIFRAVAWRAAERHEYLTEHRAAVDVAFSLEQNQYNGET